MEVRTDEILNGDILKEERLGSRVTVIHNIEVCPGRHILVIRIESEYKSIYETRESHCDEIHTVYRPNHIRPHSPGKPPVFITTPENSLPPLFYFCFGMATSTGVVAVVELVKHFIG